jgi:cardiolipin synthase
MSPWRDTHVELRGPAVQCVQLAFAEDWYWVHRVVPDVNWTPTLEPDSDMRVLVVPTSPADELEAAELLFTHIANCARERLWIATPYFVPDEQMLGALQLAALRGVDVRVIIPERNDARLVWLSAFSYYNDVLPAGIKVYRHQPGFMHQKVVVSDELACVGTANIDNRSFRINFEITVVVADEDFAERTAAMLERDMKQSRQVKAGEFEKMPFRFRLLSRAARLLAPIQ